jgi:hypothetical protein
MMSGQPEPFVGQVVYQQGPPPPGFQHQPQVMQPVMAMPMQPQVVYAQAPPVVIQQIQIPSHWSQTYE